MDFGILELHVQCGNVKIILIDIGILGLLN